MKRVIDALELVRDNCRAYGNNIRGMVGSSRSDDPRYGCLWMIHNRATLALETLDYFLRLWSSPRFRPYVVMNSVTEEREERCLEVTKSFFISAMAAIEYSSKHTINLYPKSMLWMRMAEMKERNRYIFLKGIVQESVAIGLLTDDEAEEFINLITLRNIVTHNNSISDIDDRLRIGDRHFDLKRGEMIRGDIDSFVLMSAQAVERYYGWICRLHMYPERGS